MAHRRWRVRAGGRGRQVEVLEQRLNLSTFSESEPNDSFGTADVVTIATGDVLTALAGDWLNISGNISSPSDSDFFQFTLTTRSGVFFDIDSQETGLSTTLDSVITVFDATQTNIGDNDDGYDFDTGYPAPFFTAGSSGATDSALYLDLVPGTYRVSASAAAGSGSYVLRMLADSNYSSTVPVFDSRPGVADTLYLDFDGHSANDDWGNYTINPLDISGSGTEYTPAEKLLMKNVWRMVGEDFSPFNINVSTVDPGSFNNAEAFRQVIGNSTGSEVGATGALGVAFLNSYAGSAVNTAFTFASNFSSFGGGVSGQVMAMAVEMGNTSSHEFGHALGLGHYTTAASSTASQIGIMYTPDFGLTRETWFVGTNESGLPQDDMAIIGNTTNTFGYAPEDHGKTIASPTVLTHNQGVYQATGILQSDNDADMFRFIGGQSTSIRADVDDYISNLDVGLRVVDSGGNQVASTLGLNGLDASLTLNLPLGIYYVRISSNVAAHFGVEAGQYSLTITTTPNRLPAVTLTAPAVTNDSTPDVTVSVTDPDGAIANGTVVHLDIDRNNDGDFSDPGETDAELGTTTGGVATINISPALADRIYQLRARVSDQFNEEGVSAVSQMIVDTVLPTADIEDVTPDPRIDPVGLVTITFNEAVTDFDLADLTLTRNGNPVDLTGATFVEVTPDEYTVDLAPFTTASGNYVLTLTAATSGIFDIASNLLSADAVDSFEINRAPTDITLSNNSVPENTSTLTPLTVGNVVVTDDGQGTLVLAITGGTDAAAFQLSGNQLQFVAGSVLNFEAQSSYAVQITVTDGPHTLVRDLTVLVTNVNEQPVAVAEQIQLLEGGVATSLVGGANNLLANDTDPDLPADTLTTTVVTGPTHGTLLLNPDGTFRYQHDDTENLSDSFTYQVTDLGGLTSTATVTISVTAVNEFAPTVIGESLSLLEGGTVTATIGGQTSLLVNDSDADMPNDAIQILTTASVLPAHGTVTIFADGTFRYVHSGDESTTDEFRYLIRDNAGHTSVGIVSIAITPVNDSPIARPDSLEVLEGGTATVLLNTATSVLNNDSDAETPNNGLTLSVITPPVNGSLTLNPDGTFSYAHNGSETQVDSFVYRITDPQSGTSQATVTIRIVAVNDNTPVAVNDSAQVQQGGAILALGNGAVTVIHNDIDLDLPFDAFVVTKLTNPTNGTVMLNSDGSFLYTHNGSNTSSDSFTYRLTDQAGHVSNTGTVNIAIRLINAAPVANPGGPYVVAPGTDLNLNGSGTVDPNGDVLTYRWDLKNDGIVDVTTTSPTATVPWATLAGLELVSGVTSVRLEVRDPSGLTSITSTTLTIGTEYVFAPTADTIADEFVISTIGGALDIRRAGTSTNLAPVGLTAIGSVRIVGSADNETFAVQSPSRTLAFFIDGNDGTDTVKVQGTTAADTFQVSSPSGRIIVSKTTGTPFYVSSTAETTCVLGGEGTDTLDARQVLVALTSLQLLGEGGNDTLTGGLGNDSFVGGDGTDLLSEVGPGNVTLTDTQLTGHGTDVIDVSIEAIKLTGDAGANLLDASAFTRFGVHLDGAAGNDTLLGGSRADSLVGGDGIDEVRQAVSKDAKLTNSQLQQGTAQLTSPFAILTPVTDGLSSIERVLLTGNTVVNRLDATSFTGSATLDGGAANDTLIGGAGADLILGGADNDSLLGNGGNDTIGGGTGNDKIDGGAGDDGLAGQDGNDTITGGDGNDTILGGSGNDSLRGGAGRDLIQGGTGRDNINGDGDVDTVMGGSGGGANLGDKIFDPFGEVMESFRFTLDWLSLI